MKPNLTERRTSIGSILLFTLSVNAWALDPTDVRFSCNQDNDCVLVPGPCGSAISVNKKFEGDYKEDKVRPIVTAPVQCASFVPGDWPKSARAKCVSGTCEVALGKPKKDHAENGCRIYPPQDGVTVRLKDSGNIATSKTVNLSDEECTRLTNEKLVSPAHASHSGSNDGIYEDPVIREQVEGLPTRVPLKARFRQGFGVLGEVKGRFIMHEGIDFEPAPGGEVMSAGRGVVRFIGNEKSPDRKGETELVIKLTHSGKIQTIYRGVERTLVRQGDRVAAGRAIAVMGKNPLHYEIRIRGTAVDPRIYLLDLDGTLLEKPPVDQPVEKSKTQ